MNARYRVLVEAEQDGPAAPAGFQRCARLGEKARCPACRAAFSRPHWPAPCSVARN